MSAQREDFSVSRRDVLKTACLAAVGFGAGGLGGGGCSLSPLSGAEGTAQLLGEYLTSSADLPGNERGSGFHWSWTPVSGKQALVGSGRGEPLAIEALDAGFPGTEDFTISAWVHTLGNDAEAIGDLVTKFDPEKRTGLQLSVITNGGVTNSQANLRQVQFGLDAGTEPVIQDCGRPGNNVYIFSLISHRGELYCSTCEPGVGEAGHVYHYRGGETWEDCGSPDLCNSVSAMASVGGELFVATAKYNLSGSKLTPSMNENRGGGIYRYLGESKWEDCGRIGECPAVFGMVNFRGSLIASSMYPPAGVYKYQGGKEWAFLGTAADGKRVEALTVFQGEIYGTGFNAGEIYRYEGGKEWKTVGALPETTQTYGFAIYGGELYVSTWPTAIVYKYVSDGVWEPCGRPGMELESMPLALYNGKMYTGTLPLGEMYRYDGGTKWGRIAQLDTTPDVQYRRAWSMAVHQGKLYCGTLPSGRVYSMQAGSCATADLPLEQGWHHVAGVRQGNEVRLYLDGVLAGSAQSASPIDLSNGKPWLVGGGNHAPLRGGMRELKVYRGALGESEIGGLLRGS